MGAGNAPGGGAGTAAPPLVTLDPLALGRLAIIQREPMRYIQRRIEQLDMIDDYHYGVTVSQQVLVPLHNDPQPPGEAELLIPLGQFSKDKFPDLEVSGPDGTTLAPLSRSEKGTLGAALFSANWARVFFHGIQDQDKATAIQVWGVIQRLIARVVAGSEREADVAATMLDRLVNQWTQPGRISPSIVNGLQAWSTNPDVVEAIDGLTRTRLLVARMRGFPGRTYPITLHYTERFDYANRPGGRTLEGSLAWLGLTSATIRRDVANVGQAASLWMVQSVPAGVEVLRYYWAADRHSIRQRDPVSIGMAQAVISHHPTSSQKNLDSEIRLEVQLAPSSAIGALAGLAALLLVVSTYVYQAIPGVIGSHIHAHMLPIDAVLGSTRHPHLSDSDRVLLVGLGSLFAAIPAAIVGALAYTGQSFARRISRGPRWLAGILCFLAAFFAITVSLKNLGVWGQDSAYVLSVYCFWLTGVALYIQFGPRFRKSERSRRPKKRESRSPALCRRLQFRRALLALLLWTVVTVLFARCQAELQERHWFSSDFPSNVIEALKGHVQSANTDQNVSF